jgi:hypothetical protein
MSSDVSVPGGWGVIGIELIFADDLQHAGYLRFRTTYSDGSGRALGFGSYVESVFSWESGFCWPRAGVFP